MVREGYVEKVIYKNEDNGYAVFAVEGEDGEDIFVGNLHGVAEGIYVSAGSACSAHKPQPSAALKAIGVDKSLLDSTIRFSFSVFTTEEEIDVCLQALYNIVPMLRRYSRR